MDTVLLIVSVVYATATACAVAGVILVAVGAGYHVKRWFAERRGLQPLVATEDGDGASQPVTTNPPAAL